MATLRPCRLTPSALTATLLLTLITSVTGNVCSEVVMRTSVATSVYVILCAFAVHSAPSPQSPFPQSTLSQSPASKSPDLAAAKLIFESHCALCHGIDGGGGRGPSLGRPKLARAADDEALKSLIENGIPPEMPEAWFLSKEEIAGLAAYVVPLAPIPYPSTSTATN